LRHEYSIILGYSSYSQYTLERKMAKNPETVQHFEEDLANLIIKKGKEELIVLTQLKKDMTGNKNATINGWDTSFYQN
jgi:Zn-dependent oligopeptidase